LILDLGDSVDSIEHLGLSKIASKNLSQEISLAVLVTFHHPFTPVSIVFSFSSRHDRDVLKTFRKSSALIAVLDRITPTAMLVSITQINISIRMCKSLIEVLTSLLHNCMIA
jgi:hypothetical protein